MAIALAFRLAVWLVPRVVPPLEVALRYVQTHDPEQPLRISEKTKRLLADRNVSDAELEAQLSAENGYPVTVTTVTGDFECRRIQVEWSVTGAALIDEDVRVCTFHAIKLSGSAPVNTWDPGDFTTMTGLLSTWWNSILVYYSQGLILSRIAFYKAGPQIVPPQPPVYSQDFNVPGGQSTVNLPPQVALSVTEQAGQKKNWGRFYLPAPCGRTSSAIETLTLSGRPSTDLMTAVANATDQMYEAALTANLPFCVYRPLLEANRPTGSPPSPSELPERPANAQTVEQLQIDDVYDVIRRRRWERPTLRIQRAIGSAAGSMVSAGSMAFLPEQGQDDFPEEQGQFEEPASEATS